MGTFFVKRIYQNVFTPDDVTDGNKSIHFGNELVITLFSAKQIHSEPFRFIPKHSDTYRNHYVVLLIEPLSVLFELKLKSYVPFRALVLIEFPF